MPTPASPQLLLLRSTAPLARGTRRAVYQHPDDPDALVKVACEGKAALQRDSGRRFSSWTRRLGLARLGVRAEFRRELREIAALHLRLPALPECIAGIYGLVETDLGPGIVVQKIGGRDGGLAPTLGAVLRAAGIDEARRQLILRAGACITRSQARLNNLALHNIVVAPDPVHGERLVLIDCVGEKTLIPVQRLCPWYSRRLTAKRLRRLLNRAACAAAAGVRAGSP